MFPSNLFILKSVWVGLHKFLFESFNISENTLLYNKIHISKAYTLYYRVIYGTCKYYSHISSIRLLYLMEEPLMDRNKREHPVVIQMCIKKSQSLRGFTYHLYQQPTKIRNILIINCNLAVKFSIVLYSD